MKRTTTVVSLSVMLFLASALAIGNSIAFSYGGIIDSFFSSGNNNSNTDKVDDALTEGKDLAQEITEQGVKSRIFATVDRKQICSFEYIYFARPDSTIDGQDVYQARLNMGKEMWNETQYDADLVISVPDSGNTAAIGYSQASGIPFRHGLIKNRYMGRTFIKPNQKQRELAVRMKLNVVKSVVKGKRIVMVDDSIVRGTTSGIICKLLREAGAKEVYMCVSAPPIKYPCFYGIDTSVRKELIASTLNVEQIQKYIGVDKLHFISIEGLSRAISNIPREDMCLACFNNDYPTAIPTANEEGEKYALEHK